MTKRFEDRLVPDTYRNDEPWSVAVVRVGRSVDWATLLPHEEVTIPESIAERILALGQAYKLHQISTLDSAGQNRLNCEQAATLCDEIQFLLRVVNDPAFHEYATPLLEFAVRCSRTKDVELILEVP